jgi:hypothetical protein
MPFARVVIDVIVKPPCIRRSGGTLVSLLH